MKPQKNDDKISQIMGDSEKVREIIQTGINDALLKHKQAGNPVCSLKNGKVVWVDAQDILIKQDRAS